VSPPGNQGSGDVISLLPVLSDDIVTAADTLISGSTATHMTRLVIRFCEAAST